MTEKKANHLQSENSPYLLQHALNPVDWYPWGDEALHKAGQENRLLVISIGYAACHWCHVMEHESFEDEEVARVMNGNFVSVKVDREERPDVDQVYMAAAYLTTGRGGWPLNVIALPDQRPVFAGTYYPKRDWLQILHYFSDMFRSQPGELERQAAELAAGMTRGNSVPGLVDPGPVNEELLREIISAWKEDLDFTNGGTHGAPKFPMPANLACLHYLGSRFGDKELTEYIRLTLDKIASGGIFDQLGGGFCRYSVDALWHVPHFEKMLYDNAQLTGLYSEAHAATRNYAYRQVAEETIAFVTRELTGPGGLFYSSLDADSEGREGAFYTWTSDEIEKYLGSAAGTFMDYFSCEARGNWENGTNVLRRKTAHADFAKEHGLSEDELSSFMDVSRDQLLTVRENRPRPATDDKILTCWNALMIRALVAAARAFGKQAWLEKATETAGFYRLEMLRRQGKLWRCYKDGSFTIPGFLDDYAFLAAAFLDLYQATFDTAWLDAAEMLTGETVRHFTAPDGDFFNLSSAEGPRLVRDTVELSDNVIPASNSVMASNLWVLGCLLGRDDYTRRSGRMAGKMIRAVRKNPSFHANWARLLAEMVSGPVEVSIIGNDCVALLREFDGQYLPETVFSGGSVKTPAETTPARHIPGKTMVYLCLGKSCYPPVATAAEALEMLRHSPVL